MDEREGQADGHRREAGRDALFSHGENDQDEEHGGDNFEHNGRGQRVATGRVFTVAVGGKSVGQVKAGRTAGDDVEHASGRNAAEDLRDDVGRELAGGEASGRPEADGDSRVDVTPGDRTDGVGHGQQGEAEGERHAHEADAGVGEVAGQDRASAPAEDEPEGSEEFRNRWFHMFFGCLVG